MTIPFPRTRSSQRVIIPYQQGDLDGLCGVYCVVNAAKIVFPELDHSDSLELFRSLMSHLVETDMLIEALDYGVEIGTLRSLVRCAQTHLRAHHHLRMRFSKVQKRGARWSIDTVWEAMRVRGGPHRAIIIGLSGRHEHWTVASRLTRKTLHLFDSDDLLRLRRTHCSLTGDVTRHRLNPDEVIFIDRTDPEIGRTTQGKMSLFP